LKIKEAAGDRDKNLFEFRVERNELFLSVAEGSVVFSYIFFVSLAFFGTFLGDAKKYR
jgi:hypothetical protein